jgi:hypothetical protein
MAARPAARAVVAVAGVAWALAAGDCAAQVSEGSGEIGKLRHDFQRRIDDRTRYFSTLSYQGYLSPEELTGDGQELVVKGGMSWDAREWLRLEAGAGAYNTWRDDAHDLFELRLWQAATFDWPEVHGLRRWVVRHRFMLEERYKHSDQTQTSLRGRYRLSFSLPVNRYTVEPGAFYLPVEGELFWDGGSNEVELFADKATVAAGLGFQINKGWAVELRYSWQESRATVDGGFTRDDDIIELRVKSTVRIIDYLKSR